MQTMHASTLLGSIVHLINQAAGALDKRDFVNHACKTSTNKTNRMCSIQLATTWLPFTTARLTHARAHRRQLLQSTAPRTACVHQTLCISTSPKAAQDSIHTSSTGTTNKQKQAVGKRKTKKKQGSKAPLHILPQRGSAA
jgi:hypothetical protein